MKKIYYLLLLLPLILTSCQNKSGRYIVHEFDCLDKYGSFIPPRPCSPVAMDILRPLFLNKTFKLDFQKDYAIILDEEINERMVLTSGDIEFQRELDYKESEIKRFHGETNFMGEKFNISIRYDSDSQIIFIINGTYNGEKSPVYGDRSFVFCRLSKL